MGVLRENNNSRLVRETVAPCEEMSPEFPCTDLNHRSSMSRGMEVVDRARGAGAGGKQVINNSQNKAFDLAHQDGGGVFFLEPTTEVTRFLLVMCSRRLTENIFV
jgi:hypothetical protein